MMSRITLHLRKQARARETDTALQVFSGTEGSSGIRSRLRFTRSGNGQTTSLDPLSVTVEETTVMYDDDGNVVGDPAAGKKGGAGTEEWYELRAPASPRPPAPARVASARARPPRVPDPELRYIV